MWGSLNIFTDIDECTANTHDCDSSATCTNTECSFYCTCNEGYTGDGRSCIGELQVHKSCLILPRIHLYSYDCTNSELPAKKLLCAWAPYLHTHRAEKIWLCRHRTIERPSDSTDSGRGGGKSRGNTNGGAQECHFFLTGLKKRKLTFILIYLIIMSTNDSGGWSKVFKIAFN